MNGKNLLKVLFFMLFVISTNCGVWAISNDEIADVALRHVGEYGFTCKVFVQHVIGHLGETLGQNYRQCYLNFPGSREIINFTEVERGDVIQISNANDPENYYDVLHTAIVLQNYYDGHFKVVDSNRDPSFGLTVAIGDWNPYTYVAKYPASNLLVHFYRLGSISTSSLVGIFQDGWHSESFSLSSGRSQAFVNIYNQMGGQAKMGVPADNNGGGVYVQFIKK